MTLQFLRLASLASLFASAAPLALAAGAPLPGTLQLTFSSSGASEVERNGVALGDVGIERLALSASQRVALGEGQALTYGVSHMHDRLDGGAAGTILPAELESTAANLAWFRRFGAKWSALAAIQPGSYGDGAGSRTVPGSAVLNYTADPALTWSVAVRVSPFSRNAVLAFPGVQWQFSDAWNLTVGFPRTGLSWRARETVTLRGGISFQGGAYRVDRPSAIAGTGRVLLDYRELRAGVALEWTPAPAFQLNVEAGTGGWRRFDYHEIGYRTDTGDAAAAAYGSLGVAWRF